MSNTIRPIQTQSGRLWVRISWVGLASRDPGCPGCKDDLSSNCASLLQARAETDFETAAACSVGFNFHRNDKFRPRSHSANDGVYDKLICVQGKVRKVWKRIVVCATSTAPLRELTCHVGSHSVTCHPAEVTFPPLPQPIKASTRFSDPRGMQGWVDLVGLVTYQGGIPARRRSPIPVLTGLNVEQLRSCDERRYHSAKPSQTYECFFTEYRDQGPDLQNILRLCDSLMTDSLIYQTFYDYPSENLRWKS